MWCLLLAALVKQDGAPVYREMSAKSELVATLRAGDRVHVEYAVNGEGGAWCKVARGFVNCEALDRRTEDRPHYQAWAEKPQAEAETRKPSPAPPKIVVSEQMRQVMMVRSYDTAFWAQRLSLTPAQNRAVQASLQRTGAQACLEHVALLLHESGVWDFMSLAMLGPNAPKGLEPLMLECGVAYAVHWREFQGILTEEQLKRMQEELKLGGGPWQIEATFLAKIFDVIRYLNRR